MGDAGANIDPIYEARDRQIWEMIHRAPQIEIDEEADAAYVRISNRPIERTEEMEFSSISTLIANWWG